MTSVRSDEVTQRAVPTRSVGSRVVDVIFRRREASIALVTLALVVYFSSMNSAFLTEANLRVVSHFTYVVAIIAVGQVMLLICGEIDLSAGHVYALTPFVMLFVMDAGAPMIVGIVVALAVASGIGFVNGFIRIRFEVPSLITTLGMAFLLNGLTLIISDGFPKPAPR